MSLEKRQAIESNVEALQKQITALVRLAGDSEWTKEKKEELKALSDSMHIQIQALRREWQELWD